MPGMVRDRRTLQTKAPEWHNQMLDSHTMRIRCPFSFDGQHEEVLHHIVGFQIADGFVTFFRFTAQGGEPRNTFVKAFNIDSIYSFESMGFQTMTAKQYVDTVYGTDEVVRVYAKIFAKPDEVFLPGFFDSNIGKEVAITFGEIRNSGKLVEYVIEDNGKSVLLTLERKIQVDDSVDSTKERLSYEVVDSNSEQTGTENID